MKKSRSVPVLQGVTIFLAVVLLLPAVSRGAAEYTGEAYVQNFDSLATAGEDIQFEDDLTLPGWFVLSGDSGLTYNGEAEVPFPLPKKKNKVSGIYNPSAGGGKAGGLYSFGKQKPNPETERALGAVSFGDKADFFYGVCLKNSSGSELSGFTLSYDGEQWRTVGSPAQKLMVFYRIGGENPDSSGTWIPLKDLTFTSPQIDGVKALDGNAAKNRTVALSQTVQTPVPAGEKIWVVWVDLDYQGTDDHALAIDNVQFSTVTKLVG